MKIFTFWEGNKPEYIRLCMETWKRPYILLNYDNVLEYTDIPIDKVKRFTLPMIADIVRVHVLRDNEGYWLDADTIMLSGELPDTEFVGYPERRETSIGMLHSAPMFREWAEYQDEIIMSDETPTHWATFGNMFCDKYLQEHKDVRIKDITPYWPETYMIDSPIDRYYKYLRFYFDNSYSLDDIMQTDLIMLHNSWTPTWYKESTEPLKVDCTLSNILKGERNGKDNQTRIISDRA